MNRRIFISLLVLMIVIAPNQLFAATDLVDTNENHESQDVENIMQSSDPVIDVEEKISEKSQFSHKLEAVNGEVLVGENVQFKLDVNYSTPNAEDDYRLDIIIPRVVDGKDIIFDQNLNELAVNGHIPSYNGNVLSYNFKGNAEVFSSSLLLKFKTINGADLDGVIVELESQVFDGNTKVAGQKSAISLKASKNLSLTNKLVEVETKEGLVSQEGLRISDKPIYGLGLSSNRLTNGTIAVDTSKPVEMIVKIPYGAKYVKNSLGIEPSIETQGHLTYLTWVIPLDNEHNDDYYFNLKFDLQLEVTADEFQPFSSFEIEAEAITYFIDNKSLSQTAKAENTLMPNPDEIIDNPSQGIASIPGFFGPKDGQGNIQSPGAMNNEPPEVTDGASLAWRIVASGYSAVDSVKRMNSYDVFFHPDRNLVIDQLTVGRMVYFPGFHHPSKLPLNEDVFISVSVLYENENDWTRLKSGITQNSTQSSSEIGIDGNKVVESIWLHYYTNKENEFTHMVGKNESLPSSWESLPAGLFTENIRFDTSIRSGYVGEIVSGVGLAINGVQNIGEYFTGTYNLPRLVETDTIASEWPHSSNGPSRYLIDKSANVVKPSQGDSRVIHSNVSLKLQRDNIVEAGPNVMYLDIINDKASLNSLKGPFVGYVLLPEGVKVDDDNAPIGGVISIIDSNYQGKNRQLIKVDYKGNASIGAGHRIRLEVPVIISEKVPYLLEFDFYGYYDGEFIVSAKDHPDKMHTIIVKDENDFNGNGDYTEKMYLTSNYYAYHANHLFKVDYRIKNGNEETYSQSTIHADNESLTSKITITNKQATAVKTFNLITELPTGLTKSGERRLAHYYLSDEIKLPQSMNKDFIVVYTDDIIHNDADEVNWRSFDEISNKKDIVAFKIEKIINTKSNYDDVLELTYSIRTDIVEPIDEVIMMSSSILNINDYETIRSLPITITRTKTPVHQYTVNFDTNGGNEILPYMNVMEDSLIKRPNNPIKEGYTFDGWYKEKELNNPWDFDHDKVNSNITLYAKWIKKDTKKPETKLPETGKNAPILIMGFYVLTAGLLTKAVSSRKKKN